MNNRIRFCVVVGALFIVVALAPGSVMAAEMSQLVGAWKLISCESRSESGQVQLTYGADPLGVLMYDAAGRMSVYLMRRDRQRFASDVMREGTAAEAKSALDSYLSYYGTYKVDSTEGTVSHHLEGCSYPNWTGTTQKRFLKLEGKRLTLSTPPVRIEGASVRLVVVWERMD